MSTRHVDVSQELCLFVLALHGSEKTVHNTRVHACTCVCVHLVENEFINLSIYVFQVGENNLVVIQICLICFERYFRPGVSNIRPVDS